LRQPVHTPSRQCSVCRRRRVQRCKLWPCGQPWDHQVRVSFHFILCPTFDLVMISVVNALRAGAEKKQFIARGPGGRPAVGKTQGQTPQSTGQTSQPPDEKIPQSTRGQTSQLTQAQTLQPKQGETSPSQPVQKQTSQSPDSEQQKPQTTGGQKAKRRRAPATTATSDTTAGPRR
jgi:hypothetical protein